MNIYSQIATSLTVNDINDAVLHVSAKYDISDVLIEFADAGEIIAVVEDNGYDIGYVDMSVEWTNTNANVKSWMQPIPPSQIVAESLPISNLVPLFTNNYYYFVLRQNRISGLVSYMNLDKIPFKLALFATLMDFEAELISGIRNGAKGTKHYLSTLSPARISKAHEVLKLRKEHGQTSNYKSGAEELLDCTCFADRATIWQKDPDLEKLLGFSSKRQFRQFVVLSERVRNQIAHGNSIVKLFPEPTDLVEFIQTLTSKKSAIRIVQNQAVL